MANVIDGVQIGYVRIWTVGAGESSSIYVGLGNDSPVQTQGFGGWEEVERPRRKSVTQWKGRQPWRITVPLLFDTLEDDSKGYLLERDIRSLEKMAGGGIQGEPPKVKFNSGGLIPHDEHDAGHVDWVIDGIDFGDTIRNVNGNRIRQEVTITLLEYVEDKALADRYADNLRRDAREKVKRPKHARVRAKAKDDLVKIAKREYDDWTLWRAIAEAPANKKLKLRDPRKTIKEGTLIRLPTVKRNPNG